MSDPRSRRILKEIQDIERDQLSQTSIATVGQDLTHLKGSFLGPRDTPYQGGKFTVDIVVSSDYPFRPPKIKFDTKVYHPNISSQTGAICLDILKDQWSPILTLKSALLSVQSLLECPEPSDPQDAEVARHFLSDRDGFNKTARYWAETYADAGSSTMGAASNKKSDTVDLYGLDRGSVESIVGMGFAQDRVIDAMRRLDVRRVQNDNDVDRLMAALLK